jgi:hypothetical protein
MSFMMLGAAFNIVDKLFSMLGFDDAMRGEKPPCIPTIPTLT